MTNVFNIRDGARPAAPPPMSIEAEQALLGVLLGNREMFARVAPIVEAEHFFEPLHQAIFATIRDLTREGKPATLVTVGASLCVEAPPNLPPVKTYLANLFASAFTPQDAPTWAEMIRDMAHMREVIAAADALKADIAARQPSDSPSMMLDKFATSTQHVLLAGNSAAENFYDMGERMLREIDAAREGTFQPVIFTTGFSSLDRLSMHRPGEVIVTAGRPGAGKSIYAATSARRVAQAGWGVLEIPLEIPLDQAIARHLADLCYSPDDPISFGDILNRSLDTKRKADRVAAAMERLFQLPLMIDKAERLSVAQLVTKIQIAKKAFAAKGTRLAVVSLDHLDFIKASDRYKGNRTQEIGEIMIDLKAIAQREEVVIHLFCQLNRGTEGRDDKVPKLSDLRNAGDIEQVADVVQFLYREAYYIGMSAEYIRQEPDAVAQMEMVRNKLDVICAKNRTGRTGSVELYCDPAANYLSARAR